MLQIYSVSTNARKKEKLPLLFHFKIPQRLRRTSALFSSWVYRLNLFVAFSDWLQWIVGKWRKNGKREKPFKILLTTIDKELFGSPINLDFGEINNLNFPLAGRETSWLIRLPPSLTPPVLFLSKQFWSVFFWDNRTKKDKMPCFVRNQLQDQWGIHSWNWMMPNISVDGRKSTLCWFPALLCIYDSTFRPFLWLSIHSRLAFGETF